MRAKKNPTEHRDACTTKLPTCPLCQQERYKEAFALLLEGRLAAGRMISTWPGVKNFWSWALEIAFFLKENAVIDPADPKIDPQKEEDRFKKILDVIDDGRKKMAREQPPRTWHLIHFQRWGQKAATYVEANRGV